MNANTIHYDAEQVAERALLSLDLEDMAEAYMNAEDGATLDDIAMEAGVDILCAVHEANDLFTDDPSEAVSVLQKIDERHHETDRTQYEATRLNPNGVPLPDLLETVCGMASSTVENLIVWYVGQLHEFIMTHRAGSPLNADRLADLIQGNNCP